MLFRWIPNFVPNKIFIFGCGGTGSRVVPLVAQFMKSCAWVVNPEVVLIDFDDVEEKNLTRQNFISADVGKNKAVILANRYSRAFNITMTPITAKISRYSDSDKENEAQAKFAEILSTNERRNNIFILCVDSPEARKQIIDIISRSCGQSVNNIVIDSGNENDFGQVIVSSLHGIDTSSYDREALDKVRDDIPLSMDLKFIPMNPKYFDTMKAVTTASCAELDQTMAINTLMAVNIFSIVQNIYYVKPLSFFRIDISLQYGSIPQHINLNYLKDARDTTYKGLDVGGSIKRTAMYTDLLKLVTDQERFLYERRIEEERAQRIAERLKETKPTSTISATVPAKKMKKAIPKDQSEDVVKKQIQSSSINDIINELASRPIMSTTGITNLGRDATTLANIANVIAGRR